MELVDALTEDQLFKCLDDSFGSTIFDKLLGELTPFQLWQYMERPEVDVTAYVFTYHVSWGFEATWAQESSLTEQEKQEYARKEGRPVEEIFRGVPENFDPNVKLKDIPRWAPQDWV
jgi:hypothetical protein